MGALDVFLPTPKYHFKKLRWSCSIGSISIDDILKPSFEMMHSTTLRPELELEIRSYHIVTSDRYKLKIENEHRSRKKLLLKGSLYLDSITSRSKLKRSK